jgi:hypothetical protein
MNYLEIGIVMVLGWLLMYILKDWGLMRREGVGGAGYSPFRREAFRESNNLFKRIGIGLIILGIIFVLVSIFG